MTFDEFVLRVKRRDGAVFSAINDVARKVQRAEIPAPKSIFAPLRRLYEFERDSADFVMRTAFYQPMFRAACVECGSGLLLYCGFPYIYGDLRLHVGDNCKIHARTSLVAGRVFDAPRLDIGDRTNIGFGVVISVSKHVSLGKDVRVADGCFITDNPGHPLLAKQRRDGEPPPPETIRAVCIEDDVWLGTRTIVLPGVCIGRGTVVGAGSVVTRTLPSGVLAAGNPARVLRAVDIRDKVDDALEDNAE